MDIEALVADLSRRLENLIRFGTIAEVDHGNPPRVRVKTGSLLTTWLPWATHRAGKTRTWCPPTVGEQVMILSPSGELATGSVIPALYSDAIDAPSHSADEHVIAYPDGAVIQYNHASGALSATGIKTALVQASVKVTLDVPESEITGNVTIGGNLLVKGAATISKLLSYLSGLSGKAGGGAITSISGNIAQDGGSITTTGDVSAGGKSFGGHTHKETGSVTGGPQ